MVRDLWHNDIIQFARLIAEMEAAGFFDMQDNDIRIDLMNDLQESMDLDTLEIFELVDRAQAFWDKQKERI